MNEVYLCTFVFVSFSPQSATQDLFFDERDFGRDDEFFELDLELESMPEDLFPFEVSTLGSPIETFTEGCIPAPEPAPTLPPEAPAPPSRAKPVRKRSN